MDYGRIIARAFEIARKYRALWLFGFLLALTGEGGGSAISSTGNYNFNSRDFTPQGLAPGAIPNVPAVPWNMILMIVGVAVCLTLIFTILAIIVRLISRGAVIGLVNELETNQTTPTARRGWDLGVERFASLLGVALWVNVPLALVSLLLLMLAAGPLIATIFARALSGQPLEQTGVVVPGILSSVGLLCCVGLILIVIQFLVYPFYQFFVRASVIGKRGATDSIRDGYRIVRANLGSVAVLYLLTIALSIGFGIVIFVVGLVLIAIVALPTVAVWVAGHSATPTVIVGLVLGIPAILALIFVTGLYRVFESTVWTEGYLALTAPRAATPVAASAQNP